MTAPPTPRCALVGAGRSRNGLGPYLARDLEAAGARVTAVAGRDMGRTAAVAAELEGRFDHPVSAHVAVERMLEAERPDALVIATPNAAHLPALRAALAAGTPTLCEKPLVAPEQHGAAGELLAGFAAGGLLLVENCQWPYMLPALEQLHPGATAGGIERLEMLLGPSGRGRMMIEDSLSHLLSVLQTLVPIDASTELRNVVFSERNEAGDRLRLDLELETPFPCLRATLYLRHSPRQPRPAWVSVNGVRVERRIRTSDYAMSFWSGERSVQIRDPLTALVSDFVNLLREPDVERVRAENRAIRERARLYRTILEAWDTA